MAIMNSSISNFKLFLFRFFIPIITIVSIVLFISNKLFEKYIILNSEISGAYKVNKLINKLNPLEIPIFGSSRAEGSYIPDFIDKNIFNYGMSSTQEDVTLSLLMIELKKKKTTPVIINFDLDGVNSNIGDISNYLYNSDNEIIKNLIEDKIKPFQSNFLLKYYGNYEFYAKNYLNNKFNFTKYTNKGASVEKNILTKNDFNKLVLERMSTVNHFNNDSSITNKLLHIISENNNRKFIFVIAPYHKSYFQNFNSFSRLNKFVFELKKHKNIYLIDFKDENYLDTFFINTTHLNYQGAIKFSKALKDSLIKLNII
jgi:hypothetical protein